MTMATMIDTLAMAKILEDAGVPEQQAEAQVQVMAQVLQFADTRVAAKADVDSVRKDLSAEIALVRRDLSAEIESVRKDLSAEIESVRKDVEILRADVKADMNALFIKMMGGMAVLLGLFKAFDALI